MPYSALHQGQSLSASPCLFMSCFAIAAGLRLGTDSPHVSQQKQTQMHQQEAPRHGGRITSISSWL